MQTPAIRLFAVVFVLTAFYCLSNAQNSSNSLAQDELHRGVQAYKAARYEDAILHFEDAVRSDPQLKTARLYLATAYAQRCIPAVDTTDNTKFCENAIAQFKQLLNVDPQNINAMKGIASLNFNMKRFEEAKDYHQKVAKLDPKDPEALFSIAVIDWTESYKTRMDERNTLNLKSTEPLIDQLTCAAIRSKNKDNVDEGIEMLKRALILRPDYDDAMAYMNLLYRERADIQCNDQQAYEADIKAADEWVTLTIDVKKKKAAAQRGSAGLAACASGNCVNGGGGGTREPH
jgi:tetratricopeptide (TPR) repeat protein